MSSNLDLNKLDPSDVLKPSALKAYEAGLDLIWKELLRLNSNLFVLEKLLKFPSKVVIGPRNNFLELVNIGLTENSVMVITKLVTDEGKEKGSVLRFKNWVRQQVKEKYKDAFDCVLKQKIDDIRELREAGKQFRDIRSKVIAHLIVDENYQLKYSGAPEVSLQDFNSTCKKLNGLFQVLCFGIEHPVLPLDYDPKVQHPVGVDMRSDIEYFLDLIVQNSDWYKRPESPYWNINKERLSPEDINLLNEYRRKFGEAEV